MDWFGYICAKQQLEQVDMKARRGHSMARVKTLKDDEMYLIRFVLEITDAVVIHFLFALFSPLPYSSTRSLDHFYCSDSTVTLFHAPQSRTTISSFQLLLPFAVSSKNGSLLDKQISVSLGSQHSLLLFT